MVVHIQCAIMKIYQLPTFDFCDVKYSQKEGGGAIIRRGAIFGGNTVFKIRRSKSVGSSYKVFYVEVCLHAEQQTV